MFKLIRLSITTCFLIGFLSLTYEGKPFFLYVYKYSKQIVSPAQKSTQEFLRISYHRSLDFSRQFFNNNLPMKDALDYQLSAPDRQEQESYSDDDVNELDDIFGN